MLMMMGRWSEDSDTLVFQVARLMRFVDIDVMSGEVGCWVLYVGTRVGVLVKNDMVGPLQYGSYDFPLWSGVGECQSFEWAFMSPAITEFGMLIRWVKRVVMFASSVC
jgi:hypothetical protein